MPTRVLLHVGPFNLAAADVQCLREACGDVEVVATTDATPLDELKDSQFDVLVAEEAPFHLVAWPRLRFVQLVSAGVNHLQGHPIWQSGIVVANASGTHAVAIAQYVTCAVLMLSHRMPQLLPQEMTRQWKREGMECEIIREKTAGIIGYGSIGRECARQLAALGMRVVCMKRDPMNHSDEGYISSPGTGDPQGKIPERWFGPQQLQEMLPLCDVLVVTVPSTDKTLGMIGPAELCLLNKTAAIINVARGGVVDEIALADALRNGHLAAAVVDCFTTEPIPHDHVYFDTPNIVLTPHMAGVSDCFWPVMANLLAENLRRFVENRPILNRINPLLGY